MHATTADFGQGSSPPAPYDHEFRRIGDSPMPEIDADFSASFRAEFHYARILDAPLMR